MTKRVLIIGGYGNFGRFIAQMLAREDDIQVIIAGRSMDKANAFASTLDGKNTPESHALDINSNLNDSLRSIAPDIVIHTSGPYQLQDYSVARACIEQGCHYIDLADARDFVSNINTLDSSAREHNVLICSGASSVPTLTSAIVDNYISSFERLESLDYGIATAQRTNRGLATTSAILSYAGTPFETLTDGAIRNVYGWQDTRSHSLWQLGSRLLGNCDIPDLTLFPLRYPTLTTIRFQAGLEVEVVHLTLAFLAWLVRIRLLPSLQPTAPYLLTVSRAFDFLGSDSSGFFMELAGRGDRDKSRRIIFELAARCGDGLYIPCVPAILMTKKLARGEISEIGARPCMGFIGLDEYLNALSEFDIEWRLREPDVVE